jgi:cell division protein ZapA
MPDIRVSVGGREYEVACQTGEEGFLRSAAALLDSEAAVLGPQASKVPESRLLLMAGLMLADRFAGMDDQVKAADSRLSDRDSTIADLEARLAAVEGATRLADDVHGRLNALADRAEELASLAEARG